MANRYVYSGAAGSGTGADWTNAHTSLSAAITASTAGDTFYVAHDHVGNYTANTSLAFKGSAASPDRVYCVDREGSVPPVAADLRTTAIEQTTGDFTLTVTASGATGACFIYGMIFKAGVTSTVSGSSLILYSSSGPAATFDSCTFQQASTNSSAVIAIGGTSGIRNRMTWIDCQLTFGAVGQRITLHMGGLFNWSSRSNMPILNGGSVPTTLCSNGSSTHLEMVGLDLSQLTGTIFSITSGILGLPLRMINCKLHASAVPFATPGNSSAGAYEVLGCSAVGNVSRSERYAYSGTLTTETTIVRTSGASDGTTPFSWKLVSTTNNEREFPLETFEGFIWNDTIGSSKTLTVHCVTNNVSLTNADIWLEADYLGSVATPISSRVSDGLATPLTAAATQETSTEAWTTTGIATPLYQKMEVTFTPEMVGPIRWKVRFGKTSTTVYVCPKAELS